MNVEPTPTAEIAIPALGLVTLDAHGTVAPETTPAQVVLPAPPGYEVLAELGRGGMGVVYQARQQALNRLCALKMILAGGHSGADERVRFLAEAEAIAKVKHAGIVQVYEFGTHAGLPFFSLELCEGGSLAGKLRAGPLKVEQAAKLVEQVASAVQAAHEAGIVHRDLKPANVLLSSDGSPRVTDFGLAKRVEGGGHTQTGAVLGTPAYMAPEQAEGRKDVGPAADVWALGAILYECLAGRPPFQAATPLDTILQVVAVEPVPLRQVNRAVSLDLETICHKCLQKEPGSRYASALSLAEDLCRFQKGEPIRARPVGPLERGWRWCRRNPVVAGLLATVAVTLVAGACVSTLFAVKANARAELAARRLYISDMRLAQQAWEVSNGERLSELLDGQRPEQTNGIDLRGFEWYYWRRCSRSELLSLDGAFGALSPDGNLAATVTGSDVRVWDAKTGRETLTIRVNSPIVSPLCFSADGKRLAGGAADKTVRGWDLRTAQEVFSLKDLPRNARQVCFSPDGGHLASLSAENVVRLWDLDSGKEVRTFTGHANEVLAVCFSSDGSRLGTASRDRTVKLWDVRTGQEQLSLEGHASEIWCVCFSHDGRRLASGGLDGTVKVWDVQTRREAVTFKGELMRVNGVCFSSDGTRLASASLARVFGSVSFDWTVTVWDLQTGRRMRTHKGHTREVVSVFFSPDGRVASASNDNTLKVWDGQMEAEAVILKGHTDGVRDACYSPDGASLVSGAHDGTVRVWDTRNRQAPLILKAANRQLGALIHGVAISPDGKTLAMVGQNLDLPQPKLVGLIKLWDAHTGQERHMLAGHSHTVLSVAFSPDGRRVAAAGGETGEGGEITVWDVQTGHNVLAFRGHKWAINSLCYSPDGRQLVTASDDGSVIVWDAENGKEWRRLEVRSNVFCVRFSRDGRSLVTGSADGMVRVWDLKTSREILGLRGAYGLCLRLVYQPRRQSPGQRLGRQNGEGVGPAAGAGNPHPHGTHGRSAQRVLQPGRHSTGQHLG